MDIIIQRFPTLAVNILKNLDNQSLVKFKKANRDTFQFIIGERFYWIRILKEYNEHFETSKKSWKMAISKTPAEFIKKLAVAVMTFFKTMSKTFMKIHFSPEKYQLTPLLIAAFDGEISFFKQIKEKTFDPNKISTQSETSAIHLAAYRGHIEICQHLLQDSKNENHCGKFGTTPLHFAALAGHLEVFKLFYANAGVKNPKLTQSKGEATPLYIAAVKGHLEICKLIIEKEVEKNPVNIRGDTPLHAAAQNGHLDICKIIMKNVIDKTPRNHDGNTPLHLAATSGHFHVVEFFLENITEKNPRGFVGLTPLHGAASRGFFNVCKLIFSYVDDKNPLSDQGCTPLHYAAQGGYLNVCKLIMANIDDIAHKNLRGKTPMDLAIHFNHIYVIQLFRLAAI